MDLVVFHPGKEPNGSRIQSILESPLLSGVFWRAWAESVRVPLSSPILIPSDWSVASFPSNNIQRPPSAKFVAEPIPRSQKECHLYHGRFVTDLGIRRIDHLLGSNDTDVITFEIIPELLSYRERIRLTEDNRVAGFRRQYQNVLEPAPIPQDWPARLWIRRDLARMLSGSGIPIPLDFQRFLDLCRTMKTDIQSYRIGGQCLDLESEQDLLRLLLSFLRRDIIPESSNIERHPSSRVIGPVLIGSGVRLAKDALVIGPAILDNDCLVQEGAVVHQSIVFRGKTVEPNAVIRNSMFDRMMDSAGMACGRNRLMNLVFPGFSTQDEFPYRRWRWYSYPRTVKRALDLLVSAAILTLFLPFFPILALAIKLNSRGPVFYRARRQGLYGRPFDCLKFRSMITTADSLQEKLRFINQVDGPQFKMENDPRVSSVGRFLRATNLDEIPQFLNVLMGQMSIVGPRPSPEAENQLCPFWRYARLSVRPGITGLWQMRRTRVPARDFQEWVHYDTEYVRRLSLWMDMSIAWMTARKLIGNFFDQF